MAARPIQTVILPPPSVAEALDQPLTSQLLVTDVGHYPKSHGHFRDRPQGCTQMIILLCIDGAGWWRHDGETRHSAAGEVVVIPPGHPHSYGADIADPWTLWWIHLGGAAIPHLVAQQAPFTAGPFHLGMDAAGEAAAAIRRCLDRYTASIDQATRVRASLSAWHLVDLITESANRGPNAIGDPLIIDAITYAKGRLADPPDLQTWAKAMGLRPARFSQRYRAATGHSPMDHLMRLRLQSAASLLDTSDTPVAAIAANVGFADPFHFSRRFRQIYACSPSAWRARPKG